MDARGKGGKILGNIVQGLLHKSMTPSQHIRACLENNSSYAEAVERLGATPLIDEVYLIVAGAHAMEGGVLSRGRNKLDDYWPLNATDPDGWFRLQTSEPMICFIIVCIYNVYTILQ